MAGGKTMHIATVLALVAHPVLTRGQITVPDVPASVDLSVVSGESLQLDFTAPLTDGGAAVQSYLVSKVVSYSRSRIRNGGPPSPRRPPAISLLDLAFCSGLMRRWNACGRKSSRKEAKRPRSSANVRRRRSSESNSSIEFPETRNEQN